MKKIKRIIASFLAGIMCFCTIPNDVILANEYTTSGIVIEVDEAYALPGEDVLVNISVNNNTGILGMTLNLEYGNGLELINAENGVAFKAFSLTKPGKLESPCKFTWDGQDIDSDDIKDGDILKLYFHVSDDAQIGTTIPIKISYDGKNIVDRNLNSIPVTVKGNEVFVNDYKPGDLNGDGLINMTDVILMRRHITRGYNVTINEDAADVNADGDCNISDVILLRRYVVGGYGVKLKYKKSTSDNVNKQELKKVEAKAATCTANGNIEYWYNEENGKCYKDERGITEITLASTIIEKKPHIPVVDAAVPATETTSGLTEGSHCSVCGTVLVAQKTIKAGSYEIRYNLSNGDKYLEKLIIDNSRNDVVIEKGGSMYLQDIEVDGYRFLGWYDGQGDNATQIKQITNADHSMTLYAHWEKIPYEIQFKSDLVPVDSMTNTVDKSAVLPKPSLDGYTFVGWTDFDGNIYTQIKSGRSEDITLYANWISDRNQAWAKKKLDDPLVYDDGDVILFAYELGEIRDVPIYEIENFGKINSDGVSQTVTKKYSVTTSEQLMKTYAKTVENATTKSSDWTLSSGWSEGIEVSEEWCKQNNITKEEAESIGKSDTGNWYVSNSSGGSSSNTTIDSTDTYDLKTTTNNTHSWSNDYAEKVSHGNDVKTHQTFDAGLEVSGKYSSSVSAEGNVGVGKGKAETGYEIGGKVSAEYENGKETTKKGSDTTTMKGKVFDEGGGSQTGSVSNHTTNSTNTSNWNTESGYGGSSTTSSSKTVSSALSEMISNKTGYGSSYIKNGGESSTQGQTDYASSENTYSSSVTYSTTKSEEVEMTYTTTNTKTGYHRWVMAGTAHVFGVVGYDIASKSYFVYTYSVMDDEMHRFEDYSYNDSSFTDNQNGVIPFDIPYEIAGYVNARVFATDGLEIDVDGTITAYTGSDSYVVIPDYMPVNNQDGSTSVIKVTGLAENVFKGNKNITGVKLSRYINNIPQNAFRGCEKLWQIDAYVTSVGDNAFKDCPLLSEWNISSAVTKLGSNSFEGAKVFTVKAANSSVVEHALKSGAEDITIGVDMLGDSLDNKTLDVPTGTKSVSFNGYGKTFNNLSINSNAEKTIINRLNIDSDGVMPLQVVSSDILLNQSKITNTGICAAFTSKQLTLDLYGANVMESGGDNALFCKDTNVVRTTSGLKTSLNLTGNLVTCGEISDSGNYIGFTEGSKIVKVDADTFESMLKAYKLIFDADGGECDTKSKQVDNGTSVGELPIPTREGYDFSGWYLEDGTAVTEKSVFSTGKDITLVAHWKVKEYKVTWKDGTGCTISVSRTLSPYKKAANGNIANGSKVYYGDVLNVSYNETAGYKLGETGVKDITVTKEITSNDIFAKVGKISDDWVLESEIPDEAKVLDEKWTYDKKTTITSDKSTVEGYELESSTFVWSDYGAWSGWSDNKATGSDSRKVETRQVGNGTYTYLENPGSPYPIPTRNLISGRSGDDVRWAQKFLNEVRGAGLVFDGVYGDGTKNAVRNFQNANGLTADGDIGADTRARMLSVWKDVTKMENKKTQYRYQDRSKIYTYTLSKVDHLETEEKPEESADVSNIKRWVKYVESYQLIN